VNGSFSGLTADVRSFCAHVLSHRRELQVSPEFSTTDCLAYYLVNATDVGLAASSSTTDRVINYVAITGEERKVGVTQDGPQLLWACQDIPGRSNDSWLSRPADVRQPYRRWRRAMDDHGSAEADAAGVSSFVTSGEFLFPLLSLLVEEAIVESGMQAFVGCVVVFFVFSVFDPRRGAGEALLVGFKATCGVFFGIVATLLLALCLHLYIFSNEIDVIDLAVMTSILGTALDYPIHMSLAFLLAASMRGFDPVEGERITRRLRTALGSAFVTTAAAACALLWGQLSILRKFGTYLLLVATLTYAYTTIMLPRILAVCLHAHGDDKRVQDFPGWWGLEGPGGGGGNGAPPPGSPHHPGTSPRAALEVRTAGAVDDSPVSSAPSVPPLEVGSTAPATTAAGSRELPMLEVAPSPGARSPAGLFVESPKTGATNASSVEC